MFCNQFDTVFPIGIRVLCWQEQWWFFIHHQIVSSQFHFLIHSCLFCRLRSQCIAEFVNIWLNIVQFYFYLIIALYSLLHVLVNEGSIYQNSFIVFWLIVTQFEFFLLHTLYWYVTHIIITQILLNKGTKLQTLICKFVYKIYLVYQYQYNIPIPSISLNLKHNIHIEH